MLTSIIVSWGEERSRVGKSGHGGVRQSGNHGDFSGALIDTLPLITINSLPKISPMLISLIKEFF